MTGTVILDTESTGLNTGVKLDEPVSIAVVSPSGETLFHRRIRPSVTIDDGAAAVHGITAEQLADAPTFGEVWPELAVLLDGKTIAGWNIPYDIRLLINAAHAHSVVLPAYPQRCVMREYAAAFGVQGKSGPKWWKLTVAYEQQYGLKARDLLATAHDAEADCLMTAALMNRLDSATLLTPELEDATRGAAFPVLFVAAQAMLTSRGNPYMRFTTAGGQQVSAFDGEGFNRFTKAGMPLQKWHNILAVKAADYVHALRTPIEARIVYESEWPEIVEVAPVAIEAVES